MKRLVLMVDDDPEVCDAVVRTLGRYEFEVVALSDAESAAVRLERGDVDLIVLDINLPGVSGIDFCRELRRDSNTPVIFLSGLDQDLDRIVGLEIGADDYLTKPFHPGELLARVRAVLRRSIAPTPPQEPGELSVGSVRIDLDQYLVFVDEEAVDLTRTEFMLFRTLMRHPKKVFTRDELMDGAYGPATVVAERTINSHMRRLRSKLEEAGFDPIETVRGIGYRIRP